jgi:DNA-binding PadR family transcriptional regulator
MALLAQAPRRGEEIMVALGRRRASGGDAGAGCVCSNLMLLEEIGLAAKAADDIGRPVYCLTAAGQAALQASQAP